jgi:acyl-CoA thioesterase FadM
MIYYWCRLGLILLFNAFKPHWNLNDEVSIKCRVRLLDCDGLQVMCGNQYPMYMDLGRWLQVAKAGFVKLAIKNKWAPVIRSQKIIYLKPLRLWSLFTVKVSLIGVDKKWIYHQHLFEQNGSIRAIGVTKACVWKNKRRIPIEEVLNDSRIIYEDKPLPSWTREMFPDSHERLNYFSNIK